MHANSCLIILHGNLGIRFPNRLRAYSGQSAGISEQDVGKL